MRTMLWTLTQRPPWSRSSLLEVKAANTNVIDLY